MRCPKCQKEMEFIPGEDEWPSRWACVARVPYAFGMCGLEIVVGDFPGDEAEGTSEIEDALNGRR